MKFDTIKYRFRICILFSVVAFTVVSIGMTMFVNKPFAAIIGMIAALPVFPIAYKNRDV